ncbi:hypothetical protein ABZZ79_27815 [Streptomyces sp. NPDC006458]|uniref:hypothetical protein n=1 Tax=Streptomyces sp. NPDC006458 TaxID=3154302 RepID=UPI0033BB8930
MTTPSLPEPVRDLLAAVLEAIALPRPATHDGNEVHDRLLSARVIHTRIALRAALDSGPDLGPAWIAAYLRERLAEHPITGYVTVDQEHDALDAGKTWSEGEGR